MMNGGYIRRDENSWSLFYTNERNFADRRSNKPTPNGRETTAQFRKQDHSKEERKHTEKIDVQ